MSDHRFKECNPDQLFLLPQDITSRLPEHHDLWLDPEAKYPELLKPLLRPCLSEEMIVEPVSPKVNKASYDSPDCVEVVSVKD